LQAAGDAERPLPFEFAGQAARGAVKAAEPRQVVYAVTISIDVDFIRLEPRQGGEVQIARKLAAGDRLGRIIGIIDRRQHGRLHLLRGVFGIRILNVEVVAAHVEGIALAETGQVDLVRMGCVVQPLEAVGTSEVVVALQHHVPAEGPARIDLELAFGRDHAAQVAIGIAGVGVETLAVQLVDAGGTQGRGATLESLADLRLQQNALAGEAGRLDGGVTLVGEGEIVGDRQAEAEVFRGAHLGEKEAGFALDRMIGHFDRRQDGDGAAEQFESCLFQPYCVLLAVLDDALGLDLPERRAFRMVGAGQAGGVDALVENHVRAVHPLAAFGGQAGVVGGLDSQRLDEAVGEIVGHVERVGIDAVAARLDHLDIAGGRHPAALLVVDDLARDHLIAAVIDLHTADRRHAFSVTVIEKFIGCQQKLCIFGNISCKRSSRLAVLRTRDDGRRHQSAHGDSRQQG